MRSLILIYGSAVLSVRCASNLIPGTGRTRRQRDPLTVAPFAGTERVATLTPRIPRSAAMRKIKNANFNDVLSAASLRVMRGGVRWHSQLANGLNRIGEKRVSNRQPSSAMARFRGAQQSSHGIDSATLANTTIAAILLDCGWDGNPLA